MMPRLRSRLAARLALPAASLLAAGCHWSAEPPAGPRGEPPLVVTVAASSVSLLSRQSRRLDAQVRATDGTPPGTSLALGYRSGNPCIASVSADGVLTAGRVGNTIVEAYAVAAPLTASAAVEVRVVNPPGLPLTFQSLTAGDPPALVDITQPLGGRFTVTVNVGVEFATPGARLDLTLDGRLVGSAPLVASSEGMIAVAFPVDGAARDPSTGARLFPDGTRLLRASVVAPPVAGNPGCPSIDVGPISITLVLQLRNP